jgi:hypothetical protein
MTHQAYYKNVRYNHKDVHLLVLGFCNITNNYVGISNLAKSVGKVHQIHESYGKLIATSFERI